MSDPATEAPADLLVEEAAAGIRRIVLNRPARLNALTFAMADELLALLEQLRHAADVRAVVITGAGRGFCSGHDRDDHEYPPWLPAGLGPVPRSAGTLRRLGGIVPLLRSLPQVVVVAVNGATAGLGLSLALGGDITIAGESAFFVNGFHNAGGGGAEAGISYLMPRAVGTQRAAELLLTGRRVSAAEAERIGLVLRVVPDAALAAEALRIAADVTRLSPGAVAQTKAALWAAVEAPGLAHAIELELTGQVLTLQTQDAAEQRASLAQRRPPRFTNS
jgi:enoyl-CoA hydratase